MTTSTPPEPVRGASRDDIALHYDLPTDFWRLWLDPSLTYSAALWDGIGGDPSDTEVLHAAQSAKNRAHLTWAGVGTGTHLLDIGCGWGALLAEAAQRGAVATGLTLSQSQAQNIWDRRLSGVEVLLQDWRDHTPSAPYDAIVSVGAFEHITRPGLTTGERIHAYTDFFARCYDWSEPGTRMSLQTVGLDQRTEKDEGRAAQFCSREIFPASALPRLSEITAACDRYFAVEALRSDTGHYTRTLAAWTKRLMRARDDVTALVGESTYRTFRTYLAAAELGFRHRHYTLYRLRLSRRTGVLNLAP